MKIRQVMDSDAAGVIALISGCFKEYEAEGVLFDGDGLDADLKSWASYLAEGDGIGWVAENDAGEIIASVGYGRVEGQVFELKRMYVRADQRGTRLAVKLLMKVENAVLKAGGETLIAWSDSRFKRGHQFYMREGFANTGKTRHLGDISDTTEYLFVKTL